MNEHKYTWSPDGTAVLISIWSAPFIQRQLRSTLRNQPIWDGVANYMARKGYRVNGKQCRTRIKNILVRYRDIKRSGGLNGSSIEPYFHDIDRVVTLKNSQVAALGSLSSGASGIADLQFSLHKSEGNTNQSGISISGIKLEQDSPPNISEDNIQEVEELFQDAPDQQNYFHAVDMMLDDDQSSSSAHAASSSPLSVFNPNNGSASNDGLHQNTQHGSTQETNVSEEAAEPPSRVSSKKNAHLPSRLECLVLHSIRAQNEAVTQLITAQNETFQRLIEADRERQARMESCMDRMLQRLDRLLPTLQTSNDEDSRLNRVMDRLEWLVMPHSIQHPTRHLETNKLDTILEKLDRFIPCLQQLQPSQPSRPEINIEQG